jgi:hypothetical protein
MPDREHPHVLSASNVVDVIPGSLYQEPPRAVHRHGRPLRILRHLPSRRQISSTIDHYETFRAEAAARRAVAAIH